MEGWLQYPGPYPQKIHVTPLVPGNRDCTLVHAIVLQPPPLPHTKITRSASVFIVVILGNCVVNLYLLLYSNVDKLPHSCHIIWNCVNTN